MPSTAFIGSLSTVIGGKLVVSNRTPASNPDSDAKCFFSPSTRSSGSPVSCDGAVFSARDCWRSLLIQLTLRFDVCRTRRTGTPLGRCLGRERAALVVANVERVVFE